MLLFLYKKMNLQQQDQFYQVMTRLRSRAACLGTKEAEIRVSEMDSSGMLVSRPMKKVTNIGDVVEKQEQEPIVIDLQKSKAGSDVTTTKTYDMSLPSTGDQVYKCGLHEFETKYLTEFNRHVENHGSKAASVNSGVNKVREIWDFMNGRH
jgi:hypothetical protein